MCRFFFAPHGTVVVLVYMMFMDVFRNVGSAELQELCSGIMAFINQMTPAQKEETAVIFSRLMFFCFLHTCTL